MCVYIYISIYIYGPVSRVHGPPHSPTPWGSHPLLLREPWIYDNTCGQRGGTLHLFAAVCKQVLSHGVAQWAIWINVNMSSTCDTMSMHCVEGATVTCDPIIRSLAPLFWEANSGHLRPYYPVTCDPTSLFKLTPPALHHTMVSLLLLYLNFPPCVPPCNGLHSASLFKFPPRAFHHTMVSLLLLYLNFPPLRSAIQYPAFHHKMVCILLLYLDFPLPAFHHTMVSVSLLCFNFPPCVPPYNGLHSTSLFKLPPLRSTIQWSPLCFFI